MKRRSFLKQAGVISTSLLVSTRGFSNRYQAKKQLITGSIKDGKTGIKGVVVSDGFSVVQTDAAGNYSFEQNPLARHVWYSTPAGYEFASENYLSRHYKEITNDAAYHFELRKTTVDDHHHRFIIWADPQVRNKEDVQQMMTTAVPDTQATIAAYKGALVHGISVGDLIWDNLELFDDYNKAVAQMGIPFFQTLGNHDMNYRQGGDESSDRSFKEHYGPTYYSFNRGRAHYVVLDDVRYLGEDRKYDGYITEAQLQWLEKDLQYVEKDALLIICAHIPVYNQVKNNQDLYALLKNFQQVHIMTGHTHLNNTHLAGNVFEHNHGTVCGAWWTGPICQDGSPRGYGVYEVTGNELKWQYKATGQPTSHQIQLYVDELTNQKRLIANVWNWDPSWKVEYSLDGKPLKEMTQQKGVDVLALKLFKSEQRWNGRRFPEPMETDHLFIAHFKPTVKKIKVVATDRFGNQYTAEA